MSQHSSLKNVSSSVRHRNVLKRHERIRMLQESEKWSDRKSIYRLPKQKMIKIKMKKAKSAEPQEEAKAGAPPAGAPKGAEQPARPPKVKPQAK